MNDFDRRFKKRNEDFDRFFRFSIIGGIISMIFGLGFIAFIIWVIVMLLRFYGVV